MKKHTRFIILILALLIVLSGCGKSKDKDVNAAPSPTSAQNENVQETAPPAAETDEADDVVATGANGIVADGDAGVGGGLSGNGRVVADGQVGCQGNDTRNIEDDDFLVVAAHGSSERARAAVVEVGDMYDLASAAACDIASVTFGAGECRHVVGKGRCARACGGPKH